VNEQSGTIAARIAALEQRLLVAVVQGDDNARSLARCEITRLKQQQLRPIPQQNGSGRSARPAQPPVPAR
jgi:hypothetical protein